MGGSDDAGKGGRWHNGGSRQAGSGGRGADGAGGVGVPTLCTDWEHLGSVGCSPGCRAQKSQGSPDEPY